MKINYERKTTKHNKQTLQPQIHTCTQNKNIMTKDKKQKTMLKKEKLSVPSQLTEIYILELL